MCNLMSMKKLILISTAICLLLLTPFSYGSYSIYVGKNHTIDGHILIGGSGDEVSSHWLELIKEKNYINSYLSLIRALRSLVNLFIILFIT